MEAVLLSDSSGAPSPCQLVEPRFESFPRYKRAHCIWILNRINSWELINLGEHVHFVIEYNSAPHPWRVNKSRRVCVSSPVSSLEHPVVPLAPMMIDR